LMPKLKIIADELGIGNDDIDALTGLVALALYLKNCSSYHKALRYLGLYKSRGNDGRRSKKCNGKARRYLLMLAMPIVGHEHWPPKLRDLRRILRELVRLLIKREPVGV